MAIDFNFLQQNAPKQEEPKPVEPPKSGKANITIRVDADCFMQCDGEYVEVTLKAGCMTKTQLPIGQHLLEFISEENPNIKVEKVVEFPESDKNYLVMINELKAQIAPAMPQSSLPTGEGVGRGVQMPPQNMYLNQLNQMAQMNPLAGMGSMPSMPQMPPMPGAAPQGMPPMPNSNNNK